MASARLRLKRGHLQPRLAPKILPRVLSSQPQPPPLPPSLRRKYILNRPGTMSSQPDNRVAAAAATTAQPQYDVVFLRGLALTAVIGLDTWHRKNKAQPAILDLRMRTNIALAAENDDVLKTIHYGNLCKAVSEAALAMEFSDLQSFALSICMYRYFQA